MDTWLAEAMKLADSGMTPYQIQLGNSYLTGFDPEGNEFPRDYAEARKWLEKAHANGAFTATYILGTMYEEGKGVEPDVGKAVEFYKAAAARGGFYPCVHLARIFSRGEHVSSSSELAAEWYEKVLSFESEVDDTEAIDEARRYLAEQTRK
jgi:TPR repeat protein